MNVDICLAQDIRTAVFQSKDLRCVGTYAKRVTPGDTFLPLHSFPPVNVLVLRTIHVPCRFLRKHFPDLQERLGSKDRMLQILVPFCGKTLDLHWYGSIHIVGACTLWSWSRQADKIMGQLLVCKSVI